MGAKERYDLTSDSVSCRRSLDRADSVNREPA